ncbi:hypothetical protein RGQ13_02515 [Thalassotalea psychrophila]|uniref:Lipoprotein n=1 Tax=Thalassotalea psychrophila TaxID=3065647 RepID=A0ABY9TX45_9GAMM|nr:hypothetical protein RGQ13_02515 [Colwelliaceae bacterium SQ149]
MRLICSLLCIFLLSSCVYYGTSHEIGNDPKSACAGGSAKENKKCRADLKRLNESIENQAQR